MSSSSNPRIETEIPFDVNNITAILVDDVMQTGRTTRLQSTLLWTWADQENPARCAVDRGTELLYTLTMLDCSSAHPEENVLVRLSEVDNRDEVVVVTSS